MSGKRFKLSFRQTEVFGPGGKQRALIIAVAPTQLPDWVAAVLAVEDGSIQQKIICKADFELAAKHEVVLLEVEGERAAPILYMDKTGGL